LCKKNGFSLKEIKNVFKDKHQSLCVFEKHLLSGIFSIA
jgi:hypothetical protein